MDYFEEIAEHRREEFGIVSRDLSLLAELSPEDSDLIKRIHGLEPYEEKQNPSTAIRAVKNIENPRTCYYYNALGRLIRLQAEHKSVEPYKNEEETRKTLEELRSARRNSGKTSQLSPTRLAELREFDLLYAAYYHGILPEAIKPPIRGREKSERQFDENKYTAFEEGVDAYLDGITNTNQLKRERKDVHTYIKHNLGIAHYAFLFELFLEFSKTGRMPTEEQARALPKEDSINIYYENYEALVQGWQPCFERIKLLPLDLLVIRAYRAGVPKEVGDKIGNDEDLVSVTGLFEEHPGYKKELRGMFWLAEADKIRDYVRAYRADVPREIIDRLSSGIDRSSIIELFEKHPGHRGNLTKVFTFAEKDKVWRYINTLRNPKGWMARFEVYTLFEYGSSEPTFEYALDSILREVSGIKKRRVIAEEFE